MFPAIEVKRSLAQQIEGAEVIDDRRTNRSAKKKMEVMSQLHKVIELEERQGGNADAKLIQKDHQ